MSGFPESRVAPLACQSHRALQGVAWLVVALFGALYAWVARHQINTDGLSYLDIGDAYLRGDWAAAINAYWNPFYSWLLGIALRVLAPTPYWEFGVAHLVNFVVYLGAFAGFAFFLEELRRPRRASGPGWIPLPDVPFRLVGYALFLWSSLHWIRLAVLVPDMCVAAFVYVGAALLLRLRRGAGARGTAILLGVVMGLGYLAKATMFPLAFLFLAFATLDTRDLRRALRQFAVGVIAFALVAGPFVLALSLQKGRPTFSDSGRLHYAWMVNGVRLFNWNGDPPGSGVPKHPPGRIFDPPPIHEFGTPLPGTVPEWYDPSYWYDGIRPRYDDVDGFARIVKQTTRRYAAFFRLRTVVSVALALAALLLIARRRRGRLASDLAEHWPLVAIALVVFTIYSILGFETRRVAPFFVLLALGLLAGVRLPATRTAGRAATGVLTDRKSTRL